MLLTSPLPLVSAASGQGSEPSNAATSCRINAASIAFTLPRQSTSPNSEGAGMSGAGGVGVAGARGVSVGSLGSPTVGVAVGWLGSATVGVLVGISGPAVGGTVPCMSLTVPAVP